MQAFAMNGNTSTAWRFWVDRGGTFTDVIGRAPDGKLHATKVLSNNPVRGEDAVIAGIRQLLGVATNAPLPLDRLAEVRVGTTVAKIGRASCRERELIT